MNINEARVLIVSDGRTGALNQSLGVAAMLGFPDPEVVTLKRRFASRWLGWLPLPLLYDNLPALVREAGRRDLMIGAGRGCSRVMRHLKGVNPELFLVALLRPAGKIADYDVVAVPKHDRPQAADNLIATLGNCNRITRDLLGLEADRWRKRLAAVQGVKLAVLIGGPSKHGGFTPAEGRELIKAVVTALKAQATQGAGLLVTTSRRTGAAATQAIVDELQKCQLPYYFWQPGQENARDNPYLAYLALADGVVVTADSTSMVSEAATANKPVYLWGEPKAVPRKFREFYADLAKQGRIRWWPQTEVPQLQLRPPAAGLMDTILVAGFIRARWAKRFGGKV